jgi:hypothetical protein
VEASKEIEEAIQKSVKEAELQDKEAAFKLAFGITLKWDAGKMECDLSWSVKHKLSVDEEIPNPDQLKLDISEATVQVGDGPPIPISEAKRLVEAVKRSRKGPNEQA